MGGKGKAEFWASCLPCPWRTTLGKMAARGVRPREVHRAVGTPRCPAEHRSAHRRARHLSEDRGGERLPERAGRAGGVHVRLQDYSSFYDYYEGTKKEVESYVAASYGIKVEEYKAMEKDPQGPISKMALIVKSKQDGMVKRRIIVDLRRSGANSKSFCPERIIFPIISDAIQDLRNHEISWFGVTININGEEKLVFHEVPAKIVQEILSELVNFIKTSKWAYEAEVNRRQAQLDLRGCEAVVLDSLHGLRRAHGV